MSGYVIGDLLADKYEIKAVLGAGGMGTVYRARQIDLGRDVAIKVPNPQAIEIPGFMARFSREAKLVARLVHDNIVQVYEYSEAEGNIYIVMEFVEGHDLKALVSRPPADLKVKDFARIVQASLEGLGHAHEFGIVHRDIKPHNIMVERRARGRWRVKIMDFGIAHLDANANMTMQNEQLTATGQAIGTPSYMSPEQIRGSGVSPLSDIYSMGCVIYYLFTRTTPFAGTGFTVAASHLSDPPPRIRERIPQLPDAVEALILKCLEKDPAKRPQEAAELGQAFFDAMESVGDELMSTIWKKGEEQAAAAGTDLIKPTRELSADAKTVADSEQPTAADVTVPAEGDEAIPGVKEKSAIPDSATAPSATASGTAAPEKTIPYQGPGVAQPLAPSPVRISPVKVVMIVAAVALPLLGLGTAAAIFLAGGGANPTDDPADPPPVLGGNGQTPPNGEGGDPGGIVLVDATPTPGAAEGPSTGIVTPAPTERPVVITPTPTPEPTPSPVPTPTEPPVNRRLATIEDFFQRANSLNDKTLAWRDATYDREFADHPRMEELARRIELEIATEPVMVNVEEESFTMGAREGTGNPEERPARNVTVSAFEIGRHEVTALEFAAFLNGNDLTRARRLYPGGDGATIVYDSDRGRWLPVRGKELHPATDVTWEAADAYANWLSSETRRRYRLPTEAEWERAARAGRQSMYPWGDSPPDSSRARFNVESEGTVTVVEMTGGENRLGLQHMAGNVEEWVSDWYDDRAYEAGAARDPRGPSAPPEGRRSKKVLRGGSFQTIRAEDLRVTRRGRLEPDRSLAGTGFRLARDP